MKSYVSLIRGINVSGQKKIKMTDLQALYQSLNLKDAKTYIQSGNVIFKSDEGARSLKAKIEQGIKKKFRFEASVIIIDSSELAGIVASSPFTKEEQARAYVTFFDKAPEKPDLKKLEPKKAKGDKITIKGRVAYLFMPEGYGKTKLSNNLLEKEFGEVATTRNWNTTIKLLSMVRE